LGEGSRGSLAKQLMQRLGLMKMQSRRFFVGVKELWEVPAGILKKGRVVHTLGISVRPKTYGGGWIYGMKDNIVSIGYVTGLDYLDPLIDPHAEYPKFKTHPEIAKNLSGRKNAKYGAKTINAGGWNTMPRLYADGVLLVGDCASFFERAAHQGNSHGDQIGNARGRNYSRAFQNNDFTSKRCKAFTEKVEGSWIYDELYPGAKFHGAFQAGRWSALVNTGLQYATGGFAWGFYAERASHRRARADENARRIRLQGDDIAQRYPDLKFDKQLTFDKITDVYHATVAHDEDQPVASARSRHGNLRRRCAEEYGNPCKVFVLRRFMKWNTTPKQTDAN
jgi:electron-transferring-flavoprotein dehydrogenase